MMISQKRSSLQEKTEREDMEGDLDLARKLVGRFVRIRRPIGIVEFDDIVQEVMIKLLKRKRMDRIAPGPGWIYRVVESTVVDAGRKAVRQNKYVKWTPLDEEAFSVICEKAHAREYLSLKDGSEDPAGYDNYLELNQALDELTEAQKEALLLSVEGKTYEEIASLTGAKVGTVRSRIHYAKKYARALLGARS